MSAGTSTYLYARVFVTPYAMELVVPILQYPIQKLGGENPHGWCCRKSEKAMLEMPTYGYLGSNEIACCEVWFHGVKYEAARCSRAGVFASCHRVE